MEKKGMELGSYTRRGIILMGYESKEQKDDKYWVSLAKGKFEYLKKERQYISKNWQTQYDFYIGDHWKEQPRAADRSKPVTNYCKSVTEGFTSWLTENRPRIKVDGFGKEDNKLGTGIKKCVWRVWDKNDTDLLYEKAVRDTQIFGMGYWKVRWNEDTKEIEIISIPPEYVYVPNDSKHIKKARGLIYAAPFELSEIRRMFPKKGKLVVADAIYSDVERKVTALDTGKGSLSYKQIDGSQTNVARKGDRKEPYAEGEKALSIEAWIWDEDFDDYRIITTAGGILLDNIKNPYNDKMIHFVPFWNIPDSNRFYAISEISSIIPLQRDVNVIKALIYDHLQQVSNTTWIIDSNAGVDPELITNREGLIIMKNPNSEVRREPPPDMPSAFFKTLGDIKFEIDTITGLHDVMQGRRPTGISAGIAIAELQEAAQVIVRRKARTIRTSLNWAGKLITSCMKKYYTEKKYREILGDEAFVKQLTDKNTDYDLVFDVESALATSRAAKASQARELYAGGAIDRRALLEDIDYPDREEVLQRMSVREALKDLQASGFQPGTQEGMMEQAMMQAGVGGTENADGKGGSPKKSEVPDGRGLTGRKRMPSPAGGK